MPQTEWRIIQKRTGAFHFLYSHDYLRSNVQTSFLYESWWLPKKLHLGSKVCVVHLSGSEASQAVNVWQVSECAAFSGNVPNWRTREEQRQHHSCQDNEQSTEEYSVSNQWERARARAEMHRYGHCFIRPKKHQYVNNAIVLLDQPPLKFWCEWNYCCVQLQHNQPAGKHRKIPCLRLEKISLVQQGLWWFGWKQSSRGEEQGNSFWTDVTGKTTRRKSPPPRVCSQVSWLLDKPEFNCSRRSYEYVLPEQLLHYFSANHKSWHQIENLLFGYCAQL